MTAMEGIFESQEGAPLAILVHPDVDQRVLFFFSSRRRHTSSTRDWSSDVCSSDLGTPDTRLFPAESFARAYRSAMTIGGKVGKLGYGDPRGSPNLRGAISRMLN